MISELQTSGFSAKALVQAVGGTNRPKITLTGGVNSPPSVRV